jgi:transposase
VIGNGLPVQIELSPGQMNDQPMAELLLKELPAGADVIADKGYDADWIRDLIEDQECTPHIPPKSNRYDGITYSKTKYKKRNLIERCFNKLKQFRHIATRYDRNPLNYLAMIKIAVVRLWLRFYESAAYCTVSQCRARSRPSRSTSSLTRKPITRSTSLRMIKVTITS